MIIAQNNKPFISNNNSGTTKRHYPSPNQHQRNNNSNNTDKITFEGRTINGNYYTDREYIDAINHKNNSDFNMGHIVYRYSLWECLFTDKADKHFDEVRKCIKDIKAEEEREAQEARRLKERLAEEERKAEEAEQARRLKEQQQREEAEQARKKAEAEAAKAAEEARRLKERLAAEQRRAEEAERARRIREQQQREEIERVRREAENVKRLKEQQAAEAEKVRIAKEAAEEESRIRMEKLAEQARIEREEAEKLKAKPKTREDAIAQMSALSPNKGLGTCNLHPDTLDSLMEKIIKPFAVDKINREEGLPTEVPNGLLLHSKNSEKAAEIAKALAEQILQDGFPEHYAAFSIPSEPSGFMKVLEKIKEKASANHAETGQRTVILIRDIDEAIVKPEHPNYNPDLNGFLKVFFQDCAESGCTILATAKNPTNIENAFIVNKRRFSDVVEIKTTTPTKAPQMRKVDNEVIKSGNISISVGNTDQLEKFLNNCTKPSDTEAWIDENTLALPDKSIKLADGILLALEYKPNDVEFSHSYEKARLISVEMDKPDFTERVMIGINRMMGAPLPKSNGRTPSLLDKPSPRTTATNAASISQFTAISEGQPEPLEQFLQKVANNPNNLEWVKGSFLKTSDNDMNLTYGILVALGYQKDDVLYLVTAERAKLMATEARKPNFVKRVMEGMTREFTNQDPKINEAVLSPKKSPKTETTFKEYVAISDEQPEPLSEFLQKVVDNPWGLGWVPGSFLVASGQDMDLSHGILLALGHKKEDILSLVTSEKAKLIATEARKPNFVKRVMNGVKRIA